MGAAATLPDARTSALAPTRAADAKHRVGSFARPVFEALSLSTLLQYNLQAALEMIPQQLTLLYSGAVGEETQSPYVNLPAHSSALARLTADGGGGEKKVCGCVWCALALRTVVRRVVLF